MLLASSDLAIERRLGTGGEWGQGEMGTGHQCVGASTNLIALKIGRFEGRLVLNGPGPSWPFVEMHGVHDVGSPSW